MKVSITLRKAYKALFLSVIVAFAHLLITNFAIWAGRVPEIEILKPFGIYITHLYDPLICFSLFFSFFMLMYFEDVDIAIRMNFFGKYFNYSSCSRQEIRDENGFLTFLIIFSLCLIGLPIAFVFTEIFPLNMLNEHILVSILAFVSFLFLLVCGFIVYNMTNMFFGIIFVSIVLLFVAIFYRLNLGLFFYVSSFLAYVFWIILALAKSKKLRSLTVRDGGFKVDPIN